MIVTDNVCLLFVLQCQMLGEFLSENCPDVTVQVVIKSNEDWGEYIDAVSDTIRCDLGIVSRNYTFGGEIGVGVVQDGLTVTFLVCRDSGLSLLRFLRTLLSFHLHSGG